MPWSYGNRIPNMCFGYAFHEIDLEDPPKATVTHYGPPAPIGFGYPYHKMDLENPKRAHHKTYYKCEDEPKNHATPAYRVYPNRQYYGQPHYYYPSQPTYPTRPHDGQERYYERSPQTPHYAANPSPTYAYPASSGPPTPNVNPWMGRSKAEVDHDNVVMAHREGAYKPKKLQPKDAKPEEMFWVLETDGDWGMRNFYTIENALQPGRWQVDTTRGFLVFIREEEDKKEDKK